VRSRVRRLLLALLIAGCSAAPSGDDTTPDNATDDDATDDDDATEPPDDGLLTCDGTPDTNVVWHDCYGQMPDCTKTLACVQPYIDFFEQPEVQQEIEPWPELQDPLLGELELIHLMPEGSTGPRPTILVLPGHAESATYHRDQRYGAYLPEHGFGVLIMSFRAPCSRCPTATSRPASPSGRTPRPTTCGPSTGSCRFSRSACRPSSAGAARVPQARCGPEPGVPMARGATVVQFEIDLSDVDRNVYEALELKVAQHPSESGAYLVARVLAYALEYEEGIAFSTGLANTDDPAVWVKDLTGQLRASIEIGTPQPNRLHKASKKADRVAVYCHKNTSGWLPTLTKETVHGSDAIALYSLVPGEVDRLAEAVERRNTWGISRIEDVIYVQVGDDSHELRLNRLPWPTA